MCTLEGSALTKKSSVMVCDSFPVNTLLVSPDKRWIAAGTADNSDFSPKVFLVLFDLFFTSSSMLRGVFVYRFIISDPRSTRNKRAEQL